MPENSVADFQLFTIDKISKEGISIVVNSIFFDFDKDTLRPESFIELDRLGKVLQGYKTLYIEIAGHTDDVGNDAYNLDLSRRRSLAVKDYLTRNIDSSRLKSVGYGESRPKVPNTSDENRQANRRVEFKFVK